jgi:hypothetical protein
MNVEQMLRDQARRLEQLQSQGHTSQSGELSRQTRQAANRIIRSTSGRPVPGKPRQIGGVAIAATAAEDPKSTPAMEALIRQNYKQPGALWRPSWATFRNADKLDAWKRFFAGTYDDPRPILAVACPDCQAAAWQSCTKQNGNRRSRSHNSRSRAAADQNT